MARLHQTFKWRELAAILRRQRIHPMIAESFRDSITTSRCLGKSTRATKSARLNSSTRRTSGVQRENEKRLKREAVTARNARRSSASDHSLTAHCAKVNRASGSLVSSAPIDGADAFPRFAEFLERAYCQLARAFSIRCRRGGQFAGNGWQIGKGISGALAGNIACWAGRKTWRITSSEPQGGEVKVF